MQIEERTITTAPGVELAVEIAGSGPLVIFMHGWPELGLSWRHQIGPLVDAAYQVAVPDMRGYGRSSQPREIDAYSLDAHADDMAAIANELGAKRWVAVGHDWGAPAAWRCAMRFPEAVAGVFALSVPHSLARHVPREGAYEHFYPDRFFYVRYFQQVGAPEAELDRDPRDSLKKIFFALSGDAPKDEWVKFRPRDAGLLDAFSCPDGPLSFMTDAELDAYAERYGSGFFGSISWYRNGDKSAVEAEAYPDQRIRQPAGFLCGEKEIVLSMSPHTLGEMRSLCDDLRCEIVVPGAGHWIQQERPAEVNAALLAFLGGLDLA